MHIIFVHVLQVMSKCCACKFLYGTTTSPEEISKLENALETQTEFKTEAEFYRKNGQLTLKLHVVTKYVRVLHYSGCPVFSGKPVELVKNFFLNCYVKRSNSSLWCIILRKSLRIFLKLMNNN